jgi:tellurite resistance protein TerC
MDVSMQVWVITCAVILGLFVFDFFAHVRVAHYGLTEESYIVFTANAFALMGLRQLYFLIGGLLDRLIYLSVGLSIILGFIGVKLILHALHKNALPFMNNGNYVDVPEISTLMSIGVIGAVLLITTVASLLRTRGRGKS